MERIDKIFTNDSWINLFPKTSVIHLPKTHLDHNPILLELISKNNNLLPKPFRLESFWTGQPDFVTIVKNSWFGDLFKKKNKLLTRLNDIQNSKAYDYSPFLTNLEVNLKNELNNCLKMEEEY